MSTQSWSIIIFGYNEERTIGSVIESVIKFCGENKINDFEIIVIDDGSSDNSQKIIKSFSGKYSFIKNIRHDVNLGIGPAMVRGYSEATKENVIAIPADGQFDICELKPLVNFKTGTFISFQRENTNYGFYRKIVSSTNQLFNRIFLSMNVKDVNWVKAYKNSDLKAINLELRSSLINTEICSKLRIMNYTIHEIPSVYHSRISGKPRGASFKTVSQAVVELIKLIFIIRKFRQRIRKSDK
ncbi:MAG: glycosyltransferase family 2 protein [Ignavibacteria bacterium]|nr:glycosyltransferase family 2 protein [Ignavibacteria bacterium]